MKGDNTPGLAERAAPGLPRSLEIDGCFSSSQTPPPIPIDGRRRSYRKQYSQYARLSNADRKIGRPHRAGRARLALVNDGSNVAGGDRARQLAHPHGRHPHHDD